MGLSLKSATKGVTKVAKDVGKTVKKATKHLAKPATSTLKAITKQGDVVTSLMKGDVEGAAKAGLDVVNLGKEALIDTGKMSISTATAPSRLIGEATGIKPLEDVSKNIEREGQKGADTYGSAAIDIGANIATGGGYGAGMSLARGLAQGGIGSLVSPEMIAKYGVDAVAAYVGVDPNMLKAGIAATQGDLKGAALQGIGSYAGFSPEQLNIASNLSSGKITEVAALSAGLDPNLLKDVTTGKFEQALTSGLTGTAAMYGGKMASEAGIDPETIKKAVEIGKSSLSGDLKKQALAQLGGAVGVPADILNQVSTGKFDVNELAKNANLTASLGGMANAYMPGSADQLKEQIQLGTAIASGDTRGIKDMASEYVIKKGDDFNTIAKRLGVDPKELAKANPQLKDINKIAAGAKLNLPQPVQAAITGATTAADKFMKDAQGRTIYGRNNAPILNPDYDEVLADARQMQKIKDYTPAAGETVQQYADRMGLDPNVILEQNKGKGLSLGKPIPRDMDIALPKGFQLPTKEEPGFFERMGDKISGAWESVTGGDKKAPTGKEGKGFLDTAKDFVADNKGIISGVAQGGAAYMGYKAGEKASDKVEKLAKQQLAEIQAQGKPFMDITFDPERYKQERKFLQDRISGKGYTAEEKKMQQEGDVRAARAALGLQRAGIETQARLGGTALGTAQLAAAISGAQGSQNIQSETNLAREASAQQKMEQAYQRQGVLSTQETKERADLAQNQANFGLERTKMAGGARGDLGNLEMGRAAALQNLYGAGANLVTKGLDTMQVSQPAQPQQPAVTPPPPPSQNLQTRAGAARTVASRPQPKPQSQLQPKPTLQQFNVKNEIPKYLQRPETVLDDAKKLGEQAVGSIVPDKIKNVFSSVTKEEEDDGFFGIKY